MESLELTDRPFEAHRLDLGERLDLGAFSSPEDPRQRRVVVQHSLERVDDLVVEWRLRMLWETANEDPHALDLIQLPDPVFRQNVHHSRRETAVRNYRDVLLLRLCVERFLLENDFSIP